MAPKVVLVTGVSRYLGGQLAAVLAADPTIERVIGVDSVPPSPEMLLPLSRTEFIRADIRNPLIAKLIASAEVDTVVHMNIGTAPGGAGGRTSMKELNVIGTMQLLAACQKAQTLRRLVVKSTTTVYGSSSRDPALFTEDTDARAVPSSGYAKDSVEIEGYVRRYGRRRPDVSCAVLRFTNFIGRRIDSMLTRYFSMPLVPTVFGFDARVQMLHEQDALEVLRLATIGNYNGTVNVGGDGVLLLSQAIRRAGRIPVSVPAPLVGLLGGLLRQAGVADFSPEQLRFLNFGRVVDTTRLIEDFGYRPSYTTAEAFADFCNVHPPVIGPSRIRGLERRLLRAATLNRIQEPIDA
ncbi:MAG: NAD-dependent epimerase/dehydratase family protein [Actinomycetota bacterium]|nr:NAD-dependent epimerase/dehydratase family protein [Actinomycetota bacterium]